MHETSHLDLTPQQRDLLLEGLRYIRSSRRLSFRDPLAPEDAQRDNDLREIAGLMGQLEPAGAAPARTRT